MNEVQGRDWVRISSLTPGDSIDDRSPCKLRQCHHSFPAPGFLVETIGPLQIAIAEPLRGADFGTSPNVKTAANPDPHRIWTEMSVLGNPEFLTRHPESDVNQAGLQLR